MNKEVNDRNQYKKATGKRRLVRIFQAMSSGNLLGALYWQLPMGIKDEHFGILLTE